MLTVLNKKLLSNSLFPLCAANGAKVTDGNPSCTPSSRTGHAAIWHASRDLLLLKRRWPGKLVRNSRRMNFALALTSAKLKGVQVDRIAQANVPSRPPKPPWLRWRTLCSKAMFRPGKTTDTIAPATQDPKQCRKPRRSRARSNVSMIEGSALGSPELSRGDNRLY